MILEVFAASAIAFAATIVGGQFLIPILAQAGLRAQDINKKSRPILPASGGIILLLGFFIGVIALLFAVDYIIGAQLNSTLLLVALASVVAISFIGLLDDLVGSKVRTSKVDAKAIAKNYTFFNGGIRQWQKPILTIIAAAPLMAINWGSPIISVPFIGSFALSQYLYTFILIPLAVAFSSNSFNMLEGLNGISVQMGLVAFIALALFAYHTSSYTAFAIAGVFSAALLAYTYYGSYPAKVLPGDSLTYLIGGAFAATIIIGNMQLLGLLLLIPWIAEFVLKGRVRFHANSWGLVQGDGTLRSPHGDHVYSLTHLFLRTGRFKEWQIPLTLMLVEALIAAAALAWLW